MSGFGPRCAALAALALVASCVGEMHEMNELNELDEANEIDEANELHDVGRLGGGDTERAASGLEIDPIPPICDVVLARRWRTPVALGTSPGLIGMPPRIATSADGSAMVVWLEYAGGLTYNVRSNRYSFPGIFGTWQAQPDLVGTFMYDAAGNYGTVSPEVAMDANGNAFVVWIEYAGTTTYHVKARRFMPAGGWGPAVTLDSSALYQPPQASVAADAAGNAIAVWEQQSTPSRTDLRYARFTGGAWGAAAALENSQGNARRASIAAAPNGVMVAAWTQIDVEWSAYTRRFANGAWGAITRVDSPFDSLPASNATVAVGASGDAVVTWAMLAGASHELWSNVASSAGAWSGAHRVASGLSFPAGDAAIDAGGNGVVTWGHLANGSNASGRRTLPGGALDAVTQHLDNLPAGVSRVEVDSDDAGNAIAVWIQHDGTRPNVYGRHLRHRPASPGCPELWTWGSGPFLLEQAAHQATGASVEMYAGGNAIAAWKQYDPSGETAYAAVYH